MLGYGCKEAPFGADTPNGATHHQEAVTPMATPIVSPLTAPEQARIFHRGDLAQVALCDHCTPTWDLVVEDGLEPDPIESLVIASTGEGWWTFTGDDPELIAA